MGTNIETKILALTDDDEYCQSGGQWKTEQNNFGICSNIVNMVDRSIVARGEGRLRPHLYKRACPSICPSLHPSVSNAFDKIAEIRLFVASN